MISKNAVHRKSAKGIEAIASRQHGLGPKLRSMLILIDGKRTFDELGRLSSAFGDAQELLKQLRVDGFIEEVAVEAAPKATPAPTRNLPQAQRFAVHRLTNTLGPMSEQLCMRIESSRTWEEFRTAIAHAEEIVRGIKGAQLATTITAEILAHRPA